MKNFGKWFNDLPLPMKIIFFIALYFAYTFVSRFFRKVSTSAQAVADTVAQQRVAAQIGSTKERVAVLVGYANGLQFSLWDWHKTLGFIPWWTKRMDEDEEGVYTILNDLKTVGEIKYVCSEFMSAYPSGINVSDKKSLKTSIKELFTLYEQQKISAFVWGSLT